nr:immunoglobulin light chain junction region [Mus musculus]
CQQWSSNPWTF